MLLEIWMVCVTSQLVRASVSVHESISRNLVSPPNLLHTDSSWIHLGLVLAGVSPEKAEHYYVERLEPYLESVLAFSGGTPLHLVFISDLESLDGIASQTEKTFGNVLMNRFLRYTQRWKNEKYSFPKFRVEFVDINYITKKFRKKIEEMKKNFARVNENFQIGIDGAEGKWGYWPTDKYTHDLFFISPFYHLVFPFEKFLITDADIQFVYNINLLYDEFDKFGANKLYAFAKDMSPLYRTLMYEYRTQHPDTQIGEPGPLQGVNTGVVLLHLERMRRSAQLATYTEDGAMTRLCHKYSFKGFIGDQDWWNIVVWDRPDLAHFLDCGFNYQFMEEFNQPPFDKLYPVYHQCNSTVRVRHGHNQATIEQ